MADVAGVHDDKAARQLVLSGPSVVLWLRHDRLRVDPVGDHPHPISGSTFLLEPVAHGVADGDDAVGPLEVQADHAAQRADEQAIFEAAQLRGDLREDVLGDDEQRHAEAACDGEADVSHHRRVRHAEHEIGTWPREPADERAAHVRDVIEGAQAESCPLEGGRRHANDLDAVSHLMPRPLLMAAKDSGEHADLVLVRQVPRRAR